MRLPWGRVCSSTRAASLPVLGLEVLDALGQVGEHSGTGSAGDGAAAPAETAVNSFAILARAAGPKPLALAGDPFAELHGCRETRSVQFRDHSMVIHTGSGTCALSVSSAENR